MQITCSFCLRRLVRPQSHAMHVKQKHHCEGAYRPIVATVRASTGNLVSVTRLHPDGTTQTRTPITGRKSRPPFVYRLVRL